MSLCQFDNVAISLRKGKSILPLSHGISFDIKEGEFFALVGESGSGKSITALSALGLYPEPGGFLAGGQVIFKGQNLSALHEKAWQKIRGVQISAIFQEPSAALNPLYTVGQQLKEAWTIHNKDLIQGQARIQELMQRVGLVDQERILSAYPHQLSGGMLQRICIVMALLHRPQLLIADEPTTALDVTIQAQIMELLAQLRQETGTALLMITHNLALVSTYADRICVLKEGHKVELNTADAFFAGPLHPYSRELLAATPHLETSL